MGCRAIQAGRLGAHGRHTGRQANWVNEFSDEIEHPTPRQALRHILGGYDFPILTEVDFGHRQSMLPLPSGVRARLDSGRQLLALVESTTS